jgi:hypothetical protein
MVNMTAKLQKIFVSGSNVDITKVVLDLKDKNPDLCVCSSTFTMLDDALKKNITIFRLKEPIKSKNEIPLFKFIKK